MYALMTIQPIPIQQPSCNARTLLPAPPHALLLLLPRNRRTLGSLINLKRRLSAHQHLTSFYQPERTHYLWQVRTARQLERMQVPEMEVAVVPS
jgi:hypothetical protein